MNRGEDIKEDIAFGMICMVLITIILCLLFFLGYLIYNESIADSEAKKYIGLFLISIFVVFIYCIHNQINKTKESATKYLDFLESQKEQELREKEMDLIQIKNNIEIEQQKLEKIRDDIIYISKDNSQSSPWLAERYADYFEIIDNSIEKYLRYKKNPAIKASEMVSEIKKEKRELLKENKVLQYQLSFLLYEFPMLEDAMQLNVNELKGAIEQIDSSQDIKEDYENVSSYLTPDEYQKLSECEKYQLALDRYLNKPKKSLWEIGISYERYIGYIYENSNYKVRYNGALEGFKDLGRDIIAENNEEILIIQCKYWRREKVIRENVIFQLYGTMILKQLETTKKVKGILVTTTILSDDARKIAEFLNIQVRENEIFNKTYPCIKCNINRTTKEKIYHLPFDQQYDRIQINPQIGEMYVSTTKQAEDMRF